MAVPPLPRIGTHTGLTDAGAPAHAPDLASDDSGEPLDGVLAPAGGEGEGEPEPESRGGKGGKQAKAAPVPPGFIENERRNFEASLARLETRNQKLASANAAMQAELEGLKKALARAKADRRSCLAPSFLDGLVKGHEVHVYKYGCAAFAGTALLLSAKLLLAKR